MSTFLEVAGAAMVVAGVGLWYWPAALVVAGAAMVAAGYTLGDGG